MFCTHPPRAAQHPFAAGYRAAPGGMQHGAGMPGHLQAQDGGEGSPSPLPGSARCQLLTYPLLLAPAVERHGNLAPPLGQVSPITSDEEYLSPLEEFPESGTPQHRPAMKLQPRAEHGAAHSSSESSFKAAPTFEVS